MRVNYTKFTGSIFWMMAMYAAGITLGVTSLAGWIGLAVLALLPTVVLARWWREPPQSMSERIRESIR